MRTTFRNTSDPKQRGPNESLSICDDNGIVVATVYWSSIGVHVYHLVGFDVMTHVMIGLGQCSLDNELDEPFECSNCGEHSQIWDIAKEKVVCKICGGAYIEG